jgi:hypothetical protein
VTARVLVLPLQRLGVGVVLTDVAHEFFVEVVDACEHAAGDDVALDAGEQCGKQAERPVSLVFEAVRLGPTGRQRQHAVLSVERLNGRLLVDAEHRRVGRRIQVEPNHVGRLGLEVGVVGDHVPLEPVRPHVVLSPDALHRHEGQPELGGELPAALVRRAILGLALEGVGQHARFQTGQIGLVISSCRSASLGSSFPSHV